MYHGTFIHIFKHWILSYLSKEKLKTVFFHICKKICLIGQHFFNSSPKCLNFDTLYDKVSKKISEKKVTLH